MVHVAYCIDKNYQQHFGASATSLLLNFAGDGSELTIHVVTDEADPVFRARLDRLRSVFKARLELYLVDSQALQAMAPLKGTSAAHVSTATYFRFLLPRILPETVKKLLYLDADTIVPSDIGELFKTDMAGAAVAGVSDYSAKTMAAKQNVERYINSGVILLDVEQWRREDHGARCLAFASENKAKLIFGDQCTINLLFQDRLRLLDARWNCYVTPTARALPENPGVFHFITGDKPWHAWYENDLGKAYWRYLDVSPWAGARPVQPTTVDKAHRLARLLHRQNKTAESMRVYDSIIVNTRERNPRPGA
ncbi:glycosyltransferase family 8 protein [Ramlibacter sp. WS9]|uniref:glycosyltransferase family 8 protein n=1 Tax=Ramlibacter sp. WS9 TaxID=1882741 RepID=UPI001142FC02|nr:glycosyltransferase family 8 protein [Ramlibacter sp. WS9]ROZ77019.1 glycosyltransferase family 8 protein [Ramlibacter sp. WS9]